MAGGVADVWFAARVFVRAGILRPSRPDRVVRSLLALERYGPTLAAGYRSCAARYPQRTAIVDERGTLTFAALDARTNSLANAFAARGLRPGDRVAIMCRNHRGIVGRVSRARPARPRGPTAPVPTRSSPRQPCWNGFHSTPASRR